MTPVGDPDDALVARAAVGDGAAFAALVDRHGPRVFALARRLLRSPAAAQDVVQDTFERAWRQAPHWRPGEAAFGTWLHRVAYNLCLNHLERVAGRHTPLDPDFDAPDETQPGPEHALAQRELHARMRAGVGTLPIAQRTAVSLRYASELPSVQIAAVMGLTEKAVESLLARARRALRTHLDPLREPPP